MVLPQCHYNATWEALLNPGGASDFFESGMPGAIDPRTDRFSPSNAWWLSELSRLVYRRNESEVGAVLGRPCRQDFLSRVGLVERAFFDAADVQAAFITCARGQLPPVGILVFRGTTGTWGNWKSNMSIWMSPWPQGGRVHSGFKKKFMAIWPKIIGTLHHWKAPLLYTGHSLGAALATLAAGMHPPRALYTFGSPRVGNGAFAATLKDVPIFRLYNPSDIVTFLPPSRGPLSFSHVGEAIIYRKSSSTPVPGASLRRELRSRALRALDMPPQFLADHAPANYIAGPIPE